MGGLTELAKRYILPIIVFTSIMPKESIWFFVMIVAAESKCNPLVVEKKSAFWVVLLLYCDISKHAFHQNCSEVPTRVVVTRNYVVFCVWPHSSLGVFKAIYELVAVFGGSCSKSEAVEIHKENRIPKFSPRSKLLILKEVMTESYKSCESHDSVKSLIFHGCGCT